MILNFYFLGLTYIIVYVGAISILFLFVIMITDTGKTPNSPILIQNNKESNIYGIATLLLFFIVVFSYYYTWVPVFTMEENNYIKQIFVPSYDIEFLDITDLESLGFTLYLAYPIIVVLIGVLLWCVLIGILRISGL